MCKTTAVHRNVHAASSICSIVLLHEIINETKGKKRKKVIRKASDTKNMHGGEIFIVVRT